MSIQQLSNNQFAVNDGSEILLVSKKEFLNYLSNSELLKSSEMIVINREAK